MKAGDRHIRLTLDCKVRAECGDFGSTKTCPIATALEQQVSGVNCVIVGPTRATFSGLAYLISFREGSSENIKRFIDDGEAMAINLTLREES